jgi:hypothetical protein
VSGGPALLEVEQVPARVEFLLIQVLEDVQERRGLYLHIRIGLICMFMYMKGVNMHIYLFEGVNMHMYIYVYILYKKGFNIITKGG